MWSVCTQSISRSNLRMAWSTWNELGTTQYAVGRFDWLALLQFR